MSNTADVSYKWSEKGIQPLIEQKQRNRERRTLFGSVSTQSQAKSLFNKPIEVMLKRLKST
jgi:hypothetical protein